MQSLFLWNGYLLRVRYRNRLPFVVAGDGSKPAVSCLVLLREVFSYGRVFNRVRIRDRICFVVRVVRFIVIADTKIFIRTKNENTTDFSSSIGNRNCHISFYYWEI